MSPASETLPRVLSAALLLLAIGHSLVFSASALGQSAAAPAGHSSKLRITGLRCDYQPNPVGVDNPNPGLGWLIESAYRNQKQTAYQVKVASTPAMLRSDKADLWDSGKVKSVESVHVRYAGKELRSRIQCYWQARIWDESGHASDWSQIGSWEMGLLRPEDWRGVWIGSGPAHEPRPKSGFFKTTNELAEASGPVNVDGRSTLLRKEFKTDKPIRQARVYVTGLGYYELSCNGRRVGDQVLAPAKSNYRKWVFYDTYDITAELQRGQNVLGITLGNGWFNPYKKWWEPYRMQWFGSKRALVQLHIEYTDGSSEVIGSDRSWKSAPGPVLYSCIYDGEEYDAREEKEGWDRPGYDDLGWLPANAVEAPGGMPVSQVMPSIKVIERLQPHWVKQPKPGVYIFNLGQNFSGWARFEGSGPRGTRIKLRYAEDLLPDGTLDITSNEHAAATDVYVMKGEGREVYEPRFTFHGFQYVEVTGYPGELTVSNLVGCVVHSACKNTGSFVSGNDLINHIHRATVWSQRSNLMGYPMDCPQRDERLGWFGDAMVSMEEAMANFDMPVFYRQWLDGVRRNQNATNGDISIISPRPYMPDEPDPTWSSAFLVMNWHYYLHYGDREFLSSQFQAMKGYVDFLGTQATNYILPKYWIGDWGTIVKGWKEGEPVLVGTAFYYYDARILSEAAQVLGRARDAEYYSWLADKIRHAVNETFYSPKSHHYGEGTQFSDAFPLFLGLPTPSEDQFVLVNVLKNLANNAGYFDVGVLGAKYLIEAVTMRGYPEVAFALATKLGYPTWANMLDGGRNTLSEFWDLHGSHNHVMMGSIDGWFYRTLAGIQVDPTKPGFENVVIKPFIPKSLPSVDASIDTVRGPLHVTWGQTNGMLDLRISIPVNSTATIYVPAAAKRKIATQPQIPMSGFTNGAAVFQTGSGEYFFHAVQE
jgi:alpha-L-rhamnosidase